MVRLVKGAYWDSEIKRAQVDGLEDFPVFTRKIHTDVSYLACARKLLAAPDAVFPQFATHNAQTLATIHAMAGENFYAGQYEFQCLHGMGEPLYEEVVGPASSTGRAASMRRSARTRPCSPIWCAACWRTAPTPRSSTASPIPTSRSTSCSPIRSSASAPWSRSARRIRASRCRRDLFGAARQNSRGLDLANEQVLASLAAALQAGGKLAAVPLLADGPREGSARDVTNPADRRDVVGTVIEATPEQVDAACAARQRHGRTPAGGARGDPAPGRRPDGSAADAVCWA